MEQIVDAFVPQMKEEIIEAVNPQEDVRNYTVGTLPSLRLENEYNNTSLSESSTCLFCLFDGPRVERRGRGEDRSRERFGELCSVETGTHPGADC